MKSIKNIAIAALLSVGAFAAVVYSSCTKDDCKDVVCQNGGTCVSGKCQCPTGYEGTNCETLSRAKFLTNGSTATYITAVGQDSCYMSGTYTMTVTPGTNSNEITINNFAGYGTSATLTGVVVSGSNFSKADTVTAGAVKIYNVSGSMNAAGNLISFTYTAKDATATATCHATSTKQ